MDIGEEAGGRGVSDCAFEQFLDWGLINILIDSGVGKPHSESNSFAIILYEVYSKNQVWTRKGPKGPLNKYKCSSSSISKVYNFSPSLYSF